jgi:FAD/FMN-containing dehydrogenase
VFNDVARALEFAERWELSPVCRSGGHSAAGYSGNNEMVIDLSRINYVVVDPKKECAVVGAGANFGHLNAVLDGYQLHLPGGACDDVGIAGFVQGGGYGYTSMLYGMNCDSVLDVLVMLADGSVVLASDECNRDLFCAVRGGTGNNFGVLLQVTYRLHRPGRLWGFGIKWHIGKHANGLAEALEILQSRYTGADAPSGMGHQSTFNFIGKERYFMLRGMYRGSRADGEELLAPLLKTKGAEFDISHSDSYMALNNYLNTHPEAPLYAPHSRTQAESRYLERNLSAQEWSEIIEYLRTSPNLGNFVGLEAYGGVIANRKPDEMAFLHRKARFNAYIWVLWQNEDQEAKSLAYLEKFREVFTTYSNGHAYQNYPNRANLDYRRMYWGDNFPHLLCVKDKYDPNNFFRFEQSISKPDHTSDAHTPDSTSRPWPDSKAPIKVLLKPSGIPD